MILNYSLFATHLSTKEKKLLKVIITMVMATIVIVTMVMAPMVIVTMVMVTLVMVIK